MNRVLVIDDEKSVRVTISEILKREGYIVDSACSTQEANAFIDSNPYDAIITDIIMPRVSGIENLSRIRELSPTVQIIVMTGEPTVDTAVHAVRSGANDYLTKPIQKETLLKTVRHAVNVKTLYDAKLDLERQNQVYQKSLEAIVEQRTNALQDAMQSIVILLSTVVEVRDPYTAGHQRRVGNLSAAIAKKLSAPGKTVDFLRIIGYIHDIGKIVIPTEILSKPGTLNQLEIQMINNHPQYGYEMLSRVNLPPSIAEAIYQHHERCDGSGYPRGLTTQELSYEARILMVADVVEAMISHRPYRPALGLDAALFEITRHAGTLFDAEIATACAALFRQDGYIIDDVAHSIFFPL